MELRTKKSWMKMHPKGRTPPMMMPGTAWVYTLWSGICLGIWFVLTGCSSALFLQTPMKHVTREHDTYDD